VVPRAWELKRILLIQMRYIIAISKSASSVRERARWWTILVAHILAMVQTPDETSTVCQHGTGKKDEKMKK
jgi:hypothetical protein